MQETEESELMVLKGEIEIKKKKTDGIYPKDQLRVIQVLTEGSELAKAEKDERKVRENTSKKGGKMRY